MQKCESCGAAMVPMILSSFCPNDCDKQRQGENDSEAGWETVIDFLPSDISQRVGGPDTHVRWTSKRPDGAYRTLVLFDQANKHDHWTAPEVGHLVNNPRKVDHREGGYLYRLVQRSAESWSVIRLKEGS